MYREMSHDMKDERSKDTLDPLAVPGSASQGADATIGNSFECWIS